MELIIDYYQRAHRCVSCMLRRVATLSDELVLRYLCLCEVMFKHNVLILMKQNIKRYSIKFSVQLTKSTTKIFENIKLGYYGDATRKWFLGVIRIEMGANKKLKADLDPLIK